MGCSFYFTETINGPENNKPSELVGFRSCEVNVCNNHVNPEIRIDMLDEPKVHAEATFQDIEQFLRFADAIDKLRFYFTGK